MIKFETINETLCQMVEPKPLLADAKVGDLVKRRDGHWAQIIETSGGVEFQPIEYLHNKRLIAVTINGSYTVYNDYMQDDIVEYQPLAPEGSNEWAWQMLKLGKTVYNPANYYTPSHGLINPNMLGNCSKQSFVGRQEPSGWQLYEPKIGPPKEPDYVICKRCGGTGCEIKPEPAPQYKVGDWVEYRLDGNIYYGKLCIIRRYVYYLSVTTEEILKDHAKAIMLESIIRKLPHSEVVVPITISGTVRQAYNEDGTIDNEQFQLLPNGSWDGTEMFISFDALDSHTRKLVESLLKAQ